MSFPNSEASQVSGPSFYSPSPDISQFSPKESMLSNGNGPSYAMMASGGCRRGGLLPKRYRQGGSSSHKTCGTPRQGDKTYVAIFFPSDNFHLLFIRVSLHNLLNNKNMSSSIHNHSYDLKKHYTSMSCLHPSELTKDFIDLLPAGSPHVGSMRAICTSSVGGLGPCIFLFNSRYNSKEVFRYNLHQPDMRFHRCANMAAAAVNDALHVQIGDFIYVLSYEGGGNQLVVQKYDIEKDIWTLVKDNNVITMCKYPHRYNLSKSAVPHVVINGKLHISFGYDSFVFDTEMDTWECSNLFDTFWLKRNPFYFHGQTTRGMNETANWKFANGSFAFNGRGIVWDEDILLVVPLYSSKCQLVAFQLIDNKVVNSQPFTFTDHEFHGAQLVDLGQDYFGLLPFTISCSTTEDDWCYELELVTILVSKPPQPRDDCFLECRIVRKDIVAQNILSGAIYTSKAFSV